MGTESDNKRPCDQIMHEYVQAVDLELVKFIEKVYSVDKADADRFEYKVSNISEKQKADIENLIGKPLYAKSNFIKGGVINHIENRHGKKGKADHSMADLNDVARIGYVLKNYDEVNFLRSEKGNMVISKGHTSKDGKHAKTLIYVKKINGFYSVVEAINNGKRRRLDIIGAYKSKDNPLNSGPARMPDAVVSESQAPAAVVQDVAAPVSSTTS